MVRLAKMTQAELNEYLQYAIQNLADELARANNWSAERSLAASLQSFDASMPSRSIDAPNQFLRTIIADERRVGILWYGIRGPQEAFVCDLLIYPEWRNRGYGTGALAAMEQELRHTSIELVALNVFAHNQAAARLYSRIGYSAVSTRMTKQLS